MTCCRPGFRNSAPVVLALCFLTASSTFAQTPDGIRIDWHKVVRVSQTTATLQVVVNPLLRRGSPIHDRVFEALRELQCDDVRYVPWLPYPRLGVAELEPPSQGKTSWDFSLIDPMTTDFLQATARHTGVLNFSTIPQWMFKTEKPVSYPVDPDEVTWNYEQGTELQDPTMKEVADYYARLAAWYTAGGFRDERGMWHASGHHFKIAYWEVLNEIDFEHRMSPSFYTKLYDAIVEAVHRVSPETKFIGLALASPRTEPQFFEYFLNPKNHHADVPLDMISYHFYASPSADEPLQAWPYSFFTQADGFLDGVRYIEAIRERLTPATQTDIDELGAILPYDTAPHLAQPIPNFYWNLCAAMYAYLYVELERLGIEVVGESQLVGYPTQFPSVSMVGWNTGQPNARYWVLKLLHEHFAPGDRMLQTHSDSPDIVAQAFLTRDGRRKILLINKRNRPMEVSIPGGAGAREQFVNQQTAFEGIGKATVTSDQTILSGLEVAVLTLGSPREAQ